MLTFQDADNLISALDSAFAHAAKVDAALAEYNDAAKALRDALKRGASNSIIRAAYYPTLLRRANAVRDLIAGSDAEVKLVSQLQAFEGKAFGEVFTFSLDRERYLKASATRANTRSNCVNSL